MSPRPAITPLQPITPPPTYPHAPSSPSYSTTSSSRYSSPASPTMASRAEREIIMGGLVSRPASTRSSEDWQDFDEKNVGLIEVPGIVLTEPVPDLPPRTPSPPLKSIMLLPPSSMPIPEPVTTSHRPFTPGFLSIIHGRRQSTGTTARAVILLGALALGAWHLYTTFDMAMLVEDVADSW